MSQSLLHAAPCTLFTSMVKPGSLKIHRRHLRHHLQFSAFIISKWTFSCATHHVAVPYRISTESTKSKTEEGTMVGMC
ncbi:hypothetical protein AMELA_G00161170 [Ameiurus melas]|uniref:Uncharacterized protein n=1 Tax=Ameiurus melas TaxID=219545 RepID=A0A7J6AF41_AMEME|nr:hypothetical protein AMELA_G00161170 [Ameiurus melas]